MSNPSHRFEPSDPSGSTRATHRERAERANRLIGCLLGTAAGDALGLPREGLSRQRALALQGGAPLKHRFLFGRGMLSDDTEHACMTAQALLAWPEDESGFARSLGWRLRGWLMALPAAVGFGTLRAILKLWVGFSPRTSGVMSAGNGAVMRAPILGACLAFTPERIEGFVAASTHLTHRDPRAREGALVVALAAAHAARHAPNNLDGTALLDEIRPHVQTTELRRRLDLIAVHLAKRSPAHDFATEIGCSEGVSGYVLDTVPAALYCFLAHPGDPRRAIEETILLGGGADSTGAVVGGLAGASSGASALPDEWIRGLVDHPRSSTWLRRLGERLARRFPAGIVAVGEPHTGASAWSGETGVVSPLPLFWPLLPLRNMLFLVVALLHGFRRLAPPYR